MVKEKEYFIGLDIGTNSVGWAVTDEEYNIIRKNRKYLYGSRLFDEANTAAERRSFRSTRRNLEKSKERKRFLKNIFREEINKVDKNFYDRLEDSFFYKEDKRINQTNTLFNDQNFKDKDFHTQYPTFYHLRKELMESSEKHDVRFVYLAISHIYNSRGHFLFENFEVGNSKDGDSKNILNDLLKELLIYISDLEYFNFEINNIDEFSDILLDFKMRNKFKEENLKKLVNKEAKDLIKILLGFKANLKTIYTDNDYVSETEKINISFSDSKYEEIYNDLKTNIGEDIELIDKSKAIYDFLILQKILKDSNSISESKVKSYNKYKDDLKKCKYIFKKYLDKNEYKSIFDDEKFEEKVLTYNKNKFKGIEIEKEDLQIFEYIMNTIEDKTLLERQRGSMNSVLPIQLHLYELEKILDNASSYLDFLNYKDETGLTNKEKIIEIFKFRIPYYIGPLNTKSKFAWLERKSFEKVYPWNLEEVVDIKKSAQNFITRMTRKCTYLNAENALPKESLLYSKFMVLNELNNVKINGERLKSELKKEIYDKVYMLYSKVSKSKLKNFLKTEKNLAEDVELTGVDELNANLKSHIDMKMILGDDYYKDSYQELAEDVIFWITVYNGDKNMVKEEIVDKYSSMLTEEQIKRLSSLKYSAWGNLSKKFLTQVEHYGYDTNGELVNIIDMMWENSLNLMELLSNKYKFLESLDEMKEVNVINGLNYKDIMEDLALSPSVKRSVWQTLRIVDEIKKIMKKEPKKVFVEVTRKEEIDKKRKDSRKKQLKDKFDAIKEIDTSILEEFKSMEDEKFRSKKIYLYFSQLGKCMYTGENIKLEDLFNNNTYDIDHIYPRSLTKDDSLNNLVLVKKEVNERKSDNYPIDEKIIEKRHKFWNYLKQSGLITDIKYERLIRSEELTPEDLEKFIARQLVETSQTIKNVIGIIKTMFKDTEMCYVKANAVSEFRHRKKYMKVRELNDLHHAHDAYLNIIIGNVYNLKFTKNPIMWLKKNKENNEENKFEYNLEKMFDKDIKIGDKVIYKQEEVDQKIEKFLYKVRPLHTKRLKTQKGAISKQQLIKKENIIENSLYLPIKTSNELLANNLDKYGAYQKISRSYFVLVEYIEKNKRIRALKDIPVFMSLSINSKEDVVNYLESTFGLKEVKVLIERIYIGSVFKINGGIYTLGFRTNNNIAFYMNMQLSLDKESTNYLKKILKYIEMIETDKKSKDENKKNMITKAFMITKKSNEMLYEVLKNKIKNTILINRNNKGKGNMALEMIENFNFSEKDLILQCKAIQTLLGYFSSKNTVFDFTAFGGPKGFGNLSYNEKITELEEIKLINQSVTGVYESEINLKEL